MAGFSPELIVAILVVLCGVCLLAGAVWLSGRDDDDLPPDERKCGAGRGTPD